MTTKVKTNTHNLLYRVFPQPIDMNLGIVLICSYFILTFGSLAGLYDFLNYSLKLPFIIAATTIVYAFYLIITRKVNLNTSFAKTFISMCIFIILYAALSTKLPVVRDGIVKSFAYYLSAYIVLIASVKRLSQFILVIDVWLASILFSSYHGIMQGGLLWSNKYLRDENELALLVSIALPFALFFLISFKSSLKRFSYLMCIILYSGAQIIAHSRGGMLSFSATLIFFWLIFKNKVRNFVIIIFIIVIGLNFAPDIYFEEMASLQQGIHESTADSRIYFWAKGIEMFTDHPLFGVGPLNYPYYFPQYDNGERYEIPEMRPPHSFPIQWLAELGVVGMIFLIRLQKTMLRNWRARHKYRAEMELKNDSEDISLIVNFVNVTMVAQVAFWVGSLFLSLFAYPFYWFIIFFSDALYRIMIEQMSIKSDG